MIKLSPTQWTVAGVVATFVTAGTYHVFMDDRHFHTSDAQALELRVQQEDAELKEVFTVAQAVGAVRLQVVAKESRLHDIEQELENIEIRKASNDVWKGDELRYKKLLDERNALIERLNQLK